MSEITEDSEKSSVGRFWVARRVQNYFSTEQHTYGEKLMRYVKERIDETNLITNLDEKKSTYLEMPNLTK